MNNELYSIDTSRSLKHFGVKGMKWGKHLFGGGAGGSDITAEELKEQREQEHSGKSSKLDDAIKKAKTNVSKFAESMGVGDRKKIETIRNEWERAQDNKYKHMAQTIKSESRQDQMVATRFQRNESAAFRKLENTIESYKQKPFSKVSEYLAKKKGEPRVDRILECVIDQTFRYNLMDRRKEILRDQAKRMTKERHKYHNH